MRIEEKTQKFIEKAHEIHGNKYDYSKVDYKKASEKVCIICHEKDEFGEEHGEFWQTPHDHLRNHGCPRCSGRGKLTKELFIKKANRIHNNKYDYSKVGYINTKSKVTIICPEHGEFQQTPDNHLSGQGCPKCRYIKAASSHKYPVKSVEKFIEDAKKVHGNKYDYSKFKYINNKTKGIIICPEHGEFLQDPSNHLKGRGCPECGKRIRKRKTTEEFIKQAKAIHGDKYDYSKTVYTRKQDKVLIHCNICGVDFWQEANSHINHKSGCPECNKHNKISKGEQLVIKILDSIGIKYEYLHKEFDSIHNRSFIYDFYIEKDNKKYIIEYNGRQHYMPIEYLGGEIRYEQQIIRDNSLREYCNLQNYNLLEIKYDVKDSEVENMIKNFLNENN